MSTLMQLETGNNHWKKCQHCEIQVASNVNIYYLRNNPWKTDGKGRSKTILRASFWGKLLGCPVGSEDQWLVNGLFHPLINRVYWGYNPLTNHLLTYITSWDIQVGLFSLLVCSGG